MSGQRYPKRDMLMKIAEVLQCNYKALDDYGLGSAIATGANIDVFMSSL